MQDSDMMAAGHQQEVNSLCECECEVNVSNRAVPDDFERPLRLLWPPYEIGGLPCGYYLSIYLSIFFISSPNLSGRRLDVYHTCTHGVALVRI